MSAETDGAITPSIPGNDRSYLYGDGLFETLLLTRGSLLFLPLHLDRLLAGARRLRMQLERERVSAALSDFLSRGSRRHAVVRLTVSRSGGQRGYCPSRDATCRVHIAASELQEDPLSPQPPAAMATSSIRMASQPLLAGIKHCNRLEQVLAAMEAADLGVDDVLLHRDNGEVQCTGRANVFCLRGRELITPPCDMAGVSGTRRQLILDTLAGRAGLAASVKSLRPEELEAADAMFLCSSIMGIRAVKSLDGRPAGRSDAVSELQRLYREEALSCCAD